MHKELETLHLLVAERPIYENLLLPIFDTFLQISNITQKNKEQKKLSKLFSALNA